MYPVHTCTRYTEPKIEARSRTLNLFKNVGKFKNVGADLVQHRLPAKDAPALIDDGGLNIFHGGDRRLILVHDDAFKRSPP